MKKTISTLSVLMWISFTINGQVTININDSDVNKSNQIELAAGYSEYTNVVGSIAFKIKNLAIQNLTNKNTGDSQNDRVGQTLYLKLQSNRQTYNAVSLSFLEPWLAGKVNRSLLTSFYYSSLTNMGDKYLNNESSYNSMLYAGNINSAYGSTNTAGLSEIGLSEIDPNKYMRSLGVSVCLGKELNWAEENFNFQLDFSYQLFMMKNWNYSTSPINNGKLNNLSLGLTLNYSTISKEIFPKKGAMFSLNLKVTPPYSLLNGINYSDPNISAENKYKFVEYHKWRFISKNVTPITSNNKLILMSNIQFGYLGYYNKNVQSPLERFDMGGSGMSADLVGLGTEIVSMRGYTDGSMTPRDQYTGTKQGIAYNKITFELRYPIKMTRLASIYMLSFIESGKCLSTIENYNLLNMKNAVGLGVRIYTPIFGTIGIDWGYGINKIGSLNNGNQFNLLMGQDI